MFVLLYTLSPSLCPLHTHMIKTPGKINLFLNTTTNQQSPKKKMASFSILSSCSSLKKPKFFSSLSSSCSSQTLSSVQRLPFQLKQKLVSTNGRSNSYPSVVCLRQPNVAVVTEKSWDNLILKSDTPVLVEFYASWCGPCKMVQRVIDELATEYAGRLKCFVLHADEDSSIAEEYEIKAVPVVMVFKNGKKCDSVVGTMPKEFYSAAIERVLSS